MAVFWSDKVESGQSFLEHNALESVTPFLMNLQWCHVIACSENPKILILRRFSVLLVSGVLIFVD
jgi:hypothetical protein